MNSTLDWNLYPKEFKGTTLYQIQFIPQSTDFNDCKPSWRLIVLSHQIAQHGTPAFCLEEPPSYCQNISEGPVVMVFDFEDNFKSFEVPNFFKKTYFFVSFSVTFIREMMEHAQRAMTLYLYYKYLEYNPFYHTSFLLFASTENWSEPFLMHYMPVKINKKLCFRVMILGNLEIQVGSESHFYEKSIVLITPFEHPFIVLSSNPFFLSVKYVDQTVHTYDRRDIRVSQILRPAPTLFTLFNFPHMASKTNQSQTVNTGKLCQFKLSSQFPFSEAELKKFYKTIVKEEKKKEDVNTAITSSILHNRPATIDVILTEQIRDLNVFNIISAAIKPYEKTAAKWLPLQIEPARYATFFEITYGLSIMSPPPFSGYFTVKKPASYTRIGIPNVLISKIHVNTEVPADEVIRRWIPENLKPLLGTKNAHFIVFADNSLQEIPVRNFCAHLAHAYSLCSFGKLSPFPKTPAYMFMSPNEMLGNMTAFLKDMPLIEYQEYPVIVFVIKESDFGPNTTTKFFTTYFKPSQMEKADINYFLKTAFLLYSRISIYVGSPLNTPPPDVPILLAKIHAESIFFGFRYQPPFFLKRTDANTLHVHCCWDPSKHFSVWTDDTGSSLKSLNLKNVSEIARVFQELKTMFSDINVTISLGIAYEGCSEALISPLTKMFTDVNVYTIFPTPFVQITSQIEGEEDVFIESEYESMFETNPNSLPPLACGFVASKRFPSYYMTLYFTTCKDGYKEVLFSIAKNLSELSWLSVRPEAEKRVVGYPPPLNFLLQQIQSLYYMTNRFEFLPCVDRI